MRVAIAVLVYSMMYHLVIYSELRSDSTIKFKNYLLLRCYMSKIWEIENNSRKQYFLLQEMQRKLPFLSL